MNKEQRTYLTKRVDQIAIAKKRAAEERMSQALKALPERHDVLLAAAKKAPKVIAAQMLAYLVERLSIEKSPTIYTYNWYEHVPKFATAIAAWEADRKAIDQTYKDYCGLVNAIRERIVDSIMLGGTESACVELLHKFADESVTEEQILDSVRKLTEASDEQ